MTGKGYCGYNGKIAYPDRAEARDHLMGLSRKNKRPGRLNVYRCQHCGLWHVGHEHDVGRRLRKHGN